MANVREILTRRILIQCNEKEIHVTNDMVAFVLSLVQLNPACRVEEGDEESYERVIQLVTEKLANDTKPSLIVLKNQLYFAKHYEGRDETVHKHRLRLHRKTMPLIMEICETYKLEDERDAERLYQKILVVVTLLSGMGDPRICSVLREVSLALQSVLHPSELSRYVTLSRAEKEKQLMEVMCIVAGIRLFNRDCLRGGEGIDDLPSILRDAVKRTRATIFEVLEQLMARVYKFTAAVENAVILMTNKEVEGESCGCYVKSCSSQDSNSVEEDPNLKWAIEMLTAHRQQEIYIRKLLDDTDRCESETKNLVLRLQGRLFKLHDTVRFRTAIPISQVYPQFIDFADIWMSLQDEVIVLSNINNFLWELRSLSTKVVNVFDQTVLNGLLGDNEILTDAERLEQSMGKTITECQNCTLYYPSVTKDFEKIDLEFLGFCAWTFVVGQGALIPGNPNNGVAKWKDKYYAFSSEKAAREFGRDPDGYIYQALHFVRQHPEYVYLFQVAPDIECMSDRDKVTDGTQLKLRQDRPVQTDVHILPPYIDASYSANIWDHKRAALRLANMCRRATRSTQTHTSHFRAGTCIQVAPPRDKQSQTKSDTCTNTKRLKTYIFGLRGRRDDSQHVLTFIDDHRKCCPLFVKDCGL